MNHETHKTGTSQRLTRLGIPIALAMLVLPTVALADAVQWTEAEGGNGHWYEVVIDDPKEFWPAQSASDDVGGHLVTVTTAGEREFVVALVVAHLPESGYMYLGGYQDYESDDYSEPAGGWTWVSGESWGYTDWDNQQPGCCGGNEDWLNMNPTSLRWHDGPYVEHTYMIEWSADCNGDGIVDYGQILDGTYADNDGNGVPDCCDAGEPCDVPGANLTVDDDLLDYPDANFTSIQDAVDAAMDGDTVLVYPGTYLGTGAWVINLGVKSVSIISSAGADVTIVDGEDARGGLFLEGSQGLDTVIQGFTFTRCAAEGIRAINFWRASGPTLSDCVIRDCAGQLLNAGPEHLGDQVGNPHIINCEFIDNTAQGTAAMSFNYNSPVIEDCIFRGNEARYLNFSYWGNTLPTYVNCLFEGNVVGNEGLMHARSSSKVTLQGCTFSNNSMAIDCVLAASHDVGSDGWYEVSDTTFCGNTPGNSICANWTNLGGNEFLDECTGFVDCNENGVPDYDDIDSGYSQDCNSDGVPDECQALSDCDGDGTSDLCEILNGAMDINPADGVPDDCQGAARGACCVGDSCITATADDCFDASGSYAGDGVSCTEGACGEPCPGDIDGNGIVDVIDILTVLNSWGGCP